MRIKFAFALAFIERQGISQTSLVWQNTSDLRQLFKLLSSCQSQLEKKMITKYIIVSFIIIDFIAIIGQIVRNVRFCKRLLIKLHYFRIKFEYDQLLHNLMNKRPHFTVNSYANLLMTHLIQSINLLVYELNDMNR